MSSQKSVLIVSPVATHPPYRGNRQRILQVANLFRDAGWEIQLAIGRNRTITEEARDFWPAIHRLKHSPRWRPTKGMVTFDSWYKNGLGEELSALVRTFDIDVVLLNYVFHSRCLDHLPARSVSIIDAHDVFTNRLRFAEAFDFSRGFFSCTAEDEAKYLSRADLVVGISQADSDYFDGLMQSGTVVTIPFAPQGSLSENRKATPLKSSSGKPHVGMVISGNDLNFSSLHSFISAVEERYGKNPPFQVSVAGAVRGRLLLQFPHRIRQFMKPWLSYVGPVPDIADFYGKLDVVVVPVVAGSGMAVKFAEAISQSIPVLSTIEGSRGTPVSHDLHSLKSNHELVRFLGSLDHHATAALLDSQRLCSRRQIAMVKQGWARLEELLESRLRLASLQLETIKD